MFEWWNNQKPGLLSGKAALAAAMFSALLLLNFGKIAVAASAQASSTPGPKSRGNLACKADIQRFCSEANLKQECLVARWDRISAECRNALGTSAGNRADSGN
jgi:hypothetical protein